MCNRTSYVLDAAIGLEDQGAAATQGWFRVDPGGCATVIGGEVPAGDLLLHARVLPLYAVPDLTPANGTPMCVSDKSFIHSDATQCRGAGARKVPFVAVKPRQDGGRAVVDVADSSDFDRAAAAVAGEQRLLTMAGYDALPVDGVAGAGTKAALARFLADHHGVAADNGPPWDALVAAAEQGPGIGLVWCNDSSHKVLAAWGETTGGGKYGAKPGAKGVVTRGWYDVAPHTCASAIPTPLEGRRTLYSYGVAVGPDGKPLRKAGKPLAWGGGTRLCTRSAMFEIADQTNCAARGLDVTGFAALDAKGKAGVTVHFR